MGLSEFIICLVFWFIISTFFLWLICSFIGFVIQILMLIWIGFSKLPEWIKVFIVIIIIALVVTI